MVNIVLADYVPLGIDVRHAEMQGQTNRTVSQTPLKHAANHPLSDNLPIMPPSPVNLHFLTSLHDFTVPSEKVGCSIV